MCTILKSLLVKQYYAVLWLMFTWSPYLWSLVGITLCSLLFAVITPCVYYFYVPWLIMTSQWVMILLRMPHCGTTVGNGIARDIGHGDITMGNHIAMCTYHGITVHNDIAMNLFWYVLLCQIMILRFRKLFTIVHINQ